MARPDDGLRTLAGAGVLSRARACEHEGQVVVAVGDGAARAAELQPLDDGLGKDAPEQRALRLEANRVDEAQLRLDLRRELVVARGLWAEQRGGLARSRRASTLTRAASAGQCVIGIGCTEYAP